MSDRAITLANALPPLGARPPDTCALCHRPSIAAICSGCRPAVDAARASRLAEERGAKRAAALFRARTSVPLKWRERRLRGGSPPLRRFLFAELRATDAPRADALARAAIQQAIEATPPRWVLIVGAGGVGKTSLACALALSRVDEGERDPEGPYGALARGFRFVVAEDLGRARREHRLGTPEAGLIVDAEQATMLLLDNVGGRAGGREDDACMQVLDRRYRDDLDTIVTTSLSLEAAVDRLGDGGGGGVARRLFESSLVIDLHVPHEVPVV